MMTMESIRKQLEEHRPEDVASGTGLSYATILRYRDGKVKEPTHDVMIRLSEWLEKNWPVKP